MASLLTLFPATAAEAPADAASPGGWWARRRKAIGFWTGLVCLFFLVLAVALAFWAVAPAALPQWRSSVVASGSMEPHIRTGDVVVWRTDVPEDIGNNAVVVYTDPHDESVIHRIVGKTPEGRYLLKGDANLMVDTDPVDRTQLQGWGQLLIPLIGNPGVWWSNHDYGRLVALVIGAGVALWFARKVWDPTYDTWAQPGESLVVDGTVLTGSSGPAPTRGDAEAAMASLGLDRLIDDPPPLLPPAVRALLVSVPAGART